MYMCVFLKVEGPGRVGSMEMFCITGHVWALFRVDQTVVPQFSQSHQNLMHNTSTSRGKTRNLLADSDLFLHSISGKSLVAMLIRPISFPAPLLSSARHVFTRTERRGVRKKELNGLLSVIAPICFIAVVNIFESAAEIGPVNQCPRCTPHH